MAINDPSITNIIDENRAEYDLYFENAKADAISRLDISLAEQNAQLEPDQQKSRSAILRWGRTKTSCWNVTKYNENIGYMDA